MSITSVSPFNGKSNLLYMSNACPNAGNTVKYDVSLVVVRGQLSK